jgi:hypothetical protein
MTEDEVKQAIEGTLRHALRFASRRSPEDTMADNIRAVAEQTLQSAQWLCGPKAHVERVLCDTSTGTMHCILRVPAHLAHMLDLVED